VKIAIFTRSTDTVTITIPVDLNEVDEEEVQEALAAGYLFAAEQGIPPDQEYDSYTQADGMGMWTWKLPG
jgi:hypothetical protein